MNMTEETMAAIISLSINKKMIDYGKIKKFVHFEGLEDDDKVYFTVYFVDEPDNTVRTEMAFTSTNTEVKTYKGSFKEIAEILFKGTNTPFVLVGDTLIEVDEFNFQTI